MLGIAPVPEAGRLSFRTLWTVLPCAMLVGYITKSNSGHSSSHKDVTGEQTDSERLNIVPKFNQ